MKVLFVATVVKTHIMEFHIPYLKMFKEMGWKTAVAAKNDYSNPNECVIPFCDRYYDIHFERNPIKPANIAAYKELKRMIDSENYDIIHCHTPVGAMIARLAAKDVRRKGTTVIYTAHGFHFYQGAAFINWLVYYPVEKWLSRYTDILITINQEDYKCAKNFKAKKVCYIPGVGIEIDRFALPADKHIYVRNEIRKKLKIPDDATVILSAGEINKNKNHSVVIEALAKLQDPNMHYIICGQGPLSNKCEDLARRCEIENQVTLTGYINNVEQYYQAADIFVFPSFREGLPVAMMEAMAAGLPCVASRIRGNTDLLGNDYKYYFAPSQSDELAAMLTAICADRPACGQYCHERSKLFDICVVAEQMKTIYCQTLK